MINPHTLPLNMVCLLCCQDGFPSRCCSRLCDIRSTLVVDWAVMTDVPYVPTLASVV